METINSPKKRPERPPQNPNPIKRFFSANYLNITFTAVLCIIVGFFMLKRADKTSENKKMNQSYSDDGDSSASEKQAKSNVASRHKSFVPKRSSSRDEKMNTTDDEASPEFVKGHVKTLIRVMDSQITGGELTLKHETNPRKIAEIKRRIEGAKRMRTKLKSVDPENPDTWFFMKDKKKDSDKIENDWLPPEDN